MMKSALNLSVDETVSGGTFLAKAALVLLEFRLRPEAMAWSRSGPDQFKFWLVVAPERAHLLPEVMTRFRQISGVTKIESETTAASDAFPEITD